MWGKLRQIFQFEQKFVACILRLYEYESVHRQEENNDRNYRKCIKEPEFLISSEIGQSLSSTQITKDETPFQSEHTIRNL